MTMSASGVATTMSPGLKDETGITSPHASIPGKAMDIMKLPAPGLAKPIPGKALATKKSPASAKWFQTQPVKKPYNPKELITLENMPSNAQLRSMNSAPFVTISWKATQATQGSIILFESFPKKLAATFSENCRKVEGSNVVIVGGMHARLKKVFKYMLDSAKGQGCAPPPIPEKVRYCVYVQNAVDCSFVRVPLLEQEFAARCLMIENMQVHTDDVELIYKDNTSKGMAVRDKVARSVARKLSSKTLMAYSVYCRLRKELPEFDADVKKALEEFRKPVEDEKRRARKEADRKLWSEQMKEAYEARQARREKQSAKNEIEGAGNDTTAARPIQSRTAMRVQTSLGVIWAAIPVDKDAEVVIKGGPKKKKRASKKKATAESKVDTSGILGGKDLPESGINEVKTENKEEAKDDGKVAK